MDEWELFDLENDKNEMQNLYGNPGYEKITTNLKQKIKSQPIYLFRGQQGGTSRPKSSMV